MKRKSYYHVFPFHKITKGQEIIIYGMGEVGHHYEEQLRATGYCSIAFITDKKWNDLKTKFPYVDVCPPKDVAKSDACVVIANGNSNAAEEIVGQLASYGVPKDRIIWEDLIVESCIVVDDQIIKLIDNNSVKRVGHYHIFPFQHIILGEEIVIWGMGEVGKNYSSQLDKTGYAKVIGAVDQNAESITESKVRVLPPSKIREFGNDIRVVIANGDGRVAEEIRNSLHKLGINDERIIYWDYIISTPLVVSEKISSNKLAVPFLEGSESKSINRVPPMNFAFQLMEYDVVSFDVFDTLIFRPFTRPTDLFMVLAAKLHYLEYHQIRMAAERKAREWSRLERRSNEVSFYEIYKFLERETGLNAKACMELEFETEKEFCFANPYMLEVYRILREQGVRIIFVSDMYLGRKRMKELLDSCGYDGVDEEDIFVSCDFSCGKGGSGGLYDAVRNIVGRNLRYVHIGDNWQNDVIQARRHGFDARHYQGVHALGNKHRATYDGMSDLVGSAYGGIINTHLLNGIESYSVPYEYGFIYGGVYVLGYASWIEKFAELHQIDKILFLSRDGDIYQQVFEMLPKKTNHVYTLYSRLPATRLEAARNRHFFLDRFLRRRPGDYILMNVYEWLQLCHIEKLAPMLDDYPIDLRQNVDGNVVGILEKFVIDSWEDILHCYDEEEKAAKEYFKKIIGDAKKIAIVDIGWICSGPQSLKWLFEEKWKFNVHVDCLVSGSVVFDATKVSPLIQSGDIHCYMFSRQENRNLYDFHLQNVQRCSVFMELLTQALTPTFEGFGKENGKLRFQYGIPEIENKYMITEIQRGIRDFAKRFLYYFRDEPFMLDISGYDAYLPFRMLAGYPQYFRQYFGKYAICLSVGSNPRTAHMEKVEEIMDRWEKR